MAAISDSEIDDRLKGAILLLGEEPGRTVAGNTALKAARNGLALLSFGLIAAGEKADAARDGL
jgi:hypothetical protein